MNELLKKEINNEIESCNDEFERYKNQDIFFNVFVSFFINQVRQKIYFNELFNIFSTFEKQKYIEIIKNQKKWVFYYNTHCKKCSRFHFD